MPGTQVAQRIFADKQLLNELYSALPIAGNWCFLNKLIYDKELKCILIGAVSHSVMSNSFETPWTGAHQTPLSMEFCKQESWSGEPFLSPGDIPDPGVKAKSPVSSALADGFFTVCATRLIDS